jgi:hypothetical protein
MRISLHHLAITETTPADAVLSIEAPVNRLRPYLTPMRRAARAVEGTRRVLAAAGC